MYFYKSNLKIQELKNRVKTKTKIEYDFTDEEYLIREDDRHRVFLPEQAIDMDKLKREKKLYENLMKYEYGTDSNSHYRGSKPPSDPENGPSWIIYACRTHSQITQVIYELNKVPELLKDLVVVPLSSRKFTWINKDVNPPNKTLSQNLINDKCKDMLEGDKWCYNQMGSYQEESLATKIVESTGKFEVNNHKFSCSKSKSTGYRRNCSRR